MNKTISAIIERQVPEFVRTTYPKIIQFLVAYYEWMEQADGPVSIIKSLLDYQDVDKTTAAIVDWFQKEYMMDFPKKFPIGLPSRNFSNSDDPRRELFKHIKQFYRSRGSESSFHLLLELLFDLNCSFYYPSKDMIRVSDGKWVRNRIIRTIATFGTPTELVGQEIVGALSGARAIVEKVYSRQIGNRKVYDLLLNKSSIVGTFAGTENIVSGTIQLLSIMGVSNVTIVDGGDLFSAGTELPLTGGSGYGARIKVGEIRVTAFKLGTGTGTYNTGDLVYQGGTSWSPGDPRATVESWTPLTGVLKVSHISQNFDANLTIKGPSGEFDLLYPIGRIKTIDILNNGAGYTSAPTIGYPPSVTAATIVPSIHSLIDKPGYYVGIDGQLSTTKFIQDSYFYQQFSYVIQTPEAFDSYKKIAQEIVHPLGLKMFGEVLSVHTMDSALDHAAAATIEIVDHKDTNGDADNALMISEEIKEDESSFKLGPNLRSIERFKYDWMPLENSIWPNNGMDYPNQDYYRDNIGNTQAKDFIEDEIREFVIAPWKKTNFTPELSLTTTNDFRNMFVVPRQQFSLISHTPYVSTGNLNDLLDGLIMSREPSFWLQPWAETTIDNSIDADTVSSRTLWLDPSDSIEPDYTDVIDPLTLSPTLWLKGDSGALRTLSAVTDAGTPDAWYNSAAADNFTIDASRRIAAWADETAGARNLSQSTDGYKPVLSRADNLENLIRYSEEITPIAGAWGTVRTAVLSTTELQETATTGAHYIAISTAAKVSASVPLRVAASIKRGTGSRNASVGVGGAGGTMSVNAIVDLGNGFVLGTSGTWITGPSVSADPVDSSFYRVTGTFAADPATLVHNTAIYIYNNATQSYSGDGASSIHVTRVQLQDAQADETYIQTGEVPIYRSPGNGIAAPYFDGVDDNLSNANDLIGTGDVTVAVAFKALSQGSSGGGRFIDNGKFWAYLSGGSNYLYVTSDGGVTVKYSATVAAGSNVAVITRTSAGVVNIYINGALSGNADQATGTPAAGSPTYIGNRAARDRGFHGYIGEPIIFKSILAADKIAELSDLLATGHIPGFIPSRRITRWADQSGNGRDAVQTTDGYKPVLSRADNKEQRCLKSNQLTNATYWALSYATVAKTQIGPFGEANDAHLLTDDNAGAGTQYHSISAASGYRALIAPGETVTISAAVQYSNWDRIWFGINTAIWAGANFNVQTGVVNNYNSNASYNVSNPRIEPIPGAGAGWYRISLDFTPSAASTASITILLASTTSASSPGGYVAAGRSLIVGDVALRSAAADADYLDSDTAPIYRSPGNGLTAPFFDGVDDFMTVTASTAQLFPSGAKTLVVIGTTMNPKHASNQWIVSTTTDYTFSMWFGNSGLIWGVNRDPGDDYAGGTQSPPGGTPFVAILRHGTNVSLTVNGEVSTTAAASGATSPTNRNLMLGASSTPAIGFFVGYIQEVLAFNAELSAANATAITEYASRAQPSYARNNKLYSMADRAGVCADFLQADTAKRPIECEAGNYENRILQAEDPTATTAWTLSNALAAKVGITPSGAAEFSLYDTSGAAAIHRLQQSGVSTLNGRAFRVSLVARSGSVNWIYFGHYDGNAEHDAFFNLATGQFGQVRNLASYTAEPLAGGRYLITLVGSETFTGATGRVEIRPATADNTWSYAGTGGAAVHYGEFYLATTAANAAYLPTGSFARYRGINSRRALQFNGGQALGSAATLATIFAAGAKRLYIPFRADRVDVQQRVFGTGYFRVYITAAGALCVENYDGSYDLITLATITAGTNYVLAVEHHGGNLTAWLYTSAGQVATGTVATGDTTDLTGTIQVGSTLAGAEYFYGAIGEIVTSNQWNQIKHEQEIALLREKYFNNPLNRIKSIEDQSDNTDGCEQQSLSLRPFVGSIATNRTAIQFNGAQSIDNNTNYLSDLFSDSEKMLYIPFNLASISSTEQVIFGGMETSGFFPLIFGEKTVYFSVFVDADGSLKISHRDSTGLQTINLGTITVETDYLLAVNHQSNTLYSELWDSIGLVSSGSVVSGSSVYLNVRPIVGSGYRAKYFYGTIGEILAYDHYTAINFRQTQQNLWLRYFT